MMLDCQNVGLHTTEDDLQTTENDLDILEEICCFLQINKNILNLHLNVLK